MIRNLLTPDKKQTLYWTLTIMKWIVKGEKNYSRIIISTWWKFWIEPPFFRDYCSNITVSNNFFANFNCTIVNPALVTIVNNIWLGGSSTIVPGVTIGDNTVIGAGSIVTNKSGNEVAVENPCRIIKNI